MSSFLKGIFGNKDENGEEQVAEPADDGYSAAAEHYEGEEPAEEESVEPAAPPIAEPPAFDVRAVWGARNVAEQEQERVFKAQQLLGALPAGTPADVKRQIVEASLQAFEVSIDEIVEAASHEVEALRDFIHETNDQAADFAAESNERIAALEAEIGGIRETMRQAEVEQTRLVGSANAVIEQVVPVLKFFVPHQDAVSGETEDDKEPTLVGHRQATQEAEAMESGSESVKVDLNAKLDDVEDAWGEADRA